MKLNSIRDLKGLSPVLADSYAEGVDPVYWVFKEASKGKWENITIIASGLIGNEYPKTFGHYHSSFVNETYHLVSGKGILVLQKKHFDKESGVWTPEIVDEVFFVTANPGDSVIITPEYGHSWSNIGDEPLISFDDWRSGHQNSDYEEIQRLKGLAYYLTFQEGKMKVVPNTNYVNHPQPVFITVDEFNCKAVQ